MTIDAYTKTVLTGILLCLAWLCVTLTPVGSPVQAQLGPTPVAIVGYQVAGSAGVQPLHGGLPVLVVSGTAPAVTGTPAPTTGAAAVPLVSTPAPKPAPAAQAVSGRCQAITKKGTQCSRNAKPGGSYCWQHGG